MGPCQATISTLREPNQHLHVSYGHDVSCPALLLACSLYVQPYDVPQRGQYSPKYAALHDDATAAPVQP